MRIYTVTRAGQPIAVVRAANRIDAIDTAMVMTGVIEPEEAFDVREPSDAEMVGWLERRADYVVAERTAAA